MTAAWAPLRTWRQSSPSAMSTFASTRRIAQSSVCRSESSDASSSIGTRCRIVPAVVDTRSVSCDVGAGVASHDGSSRLTGKSTRRPGSRCDRWSGGTASSYPASPGSKISRSIGRSDPLVTFTCTRRWGRSRVYCTTVADRPSTELAGCPSERRSKEPAVESAAGEHAASSRATRRRARDRRLMDQVCTTPADHRTLRRSPVASPGRSPSSGRARAATADGSLRIRLRPACRGRAR